MSQEAKTFKLNCSSCYERFEPKSLLIELPCGHFLHSNCSCRKCPYCRFPVQKLFKSQVDTETKVSNLLRFLKSKSLEREIEE